MIFHRSLFLLTIFRVAISVANAQGDYGVDCSWPIHSEEFEFKCGDLLGDREAVYNEYMEGCRQKWGKKGAARCDSNEGDRVEMSLRQPQSMFNYTETGFKKMKAPKPLWNLLKNYWEANKENKEKEDWGMGNVYTNNWKAPTYMVNVENRKLRAGGSSMKNKIWDAAKSTLEAWTGMKLQPTSLYGIRVYTEGAILAPHVDRLPLVSSCIINVAQDVEEDWVLEVYDRHDRAVNVTMEPGDMVLYESGSLLHGRPFALKGNFYANVFVHFEPTGEHLHDNGFDDVDDFYPPYLLLDSPEIDNWARRNPSGWRKHSPSAAGLARPKGHSAAALGDVDSLQRLAREDKNAMHTKDVNGWQPIHEAARAGNLKVVKLLVEKHGADVNSVTNFGEGSSVYNIAAQSFSPDHPVAIYLKSMGAKNIGPEL